jgi:dienelactone hydrolase
VNRRRLQRLAAILAASALLAACTGGGASPGPTGGGASLGPTRVHEVIDVVYAKALVAPARDLALDVYAPPGAGPFPMVVYMPGGGQQKDSGITLARKLAERGVVVLVADHHHGTGMDDPPLGSASRDTLEQAECALRMAREVGSDYGGDTDGLTWTGYSYGGYIGFEVALADPDAEQQWDEFVAVHGGPSRQYECVAAGEPVPVTALVVTGAVRFADLWPDAYAADPAVRDLVATTVRIGNNPDLVVRMIHGTADEEAPYALAERLAAQLRNAGYDAELTTVRGGDHAPNTELMAATVLEVLGR